MSQRNTVIRSLHDLGLAAWFGGSLMGSVGLNGAAEEAGTQVRTARISSAGWKKWTPVNFAAIVAHLIGGAGLLGANRGRVAAQKGVGASTGVKMAFTGAALGATAYARVLGKKIELASSPDQGDAEAADSVPVSVESAQRQLALVQWTIPVTTGALLVLNALHGEQQKPEEQASGILGKAGQALGVSS